MTELLPSVVILTVLATGAVLAGVARLVLPSSRRLAWSTTIVTGVLGAALAWLPLDLLAPATPLVPWLAAGIAGAVLAVGVATTVLLARARAKARGTPDASTVELIAMGEGERMELKATARYNTRTSVRDPRIEDEVVVTVAGFMNATGGTLLIGVEDDGSVRGLHEDYSVSPGKNRDGYQLWMRTMLAERLGKAVTADVGVAFEVVDGKDVCRVDVAPADGPVFVGSVGGARTADFHLRVGNATRRLLTDEVLEYRARRWS
ncbi:MAG TPA: ATP-binding protein [Candidatus Limnocylindrales bacterium]|nr:ATP-binding protein [Candidatus Limnocylindrales bacterium]